MTPFEVNLLAKDRKPGICHPCVRESVGGTRCRLSKPYIQESDTSPSTMQFSRSVPSRTKPSFSNTRADAMFRVSVSAWTRFKSKATNAQSTKTPTASVAKPWPQADSLKQQPIDALRWSGFHPAKQHHPRNRPSAVSIANLAPLPAFSICLQVVRKRCARANSLQGGESQYRNTRGLLWSSKRAPASVSTKGRNIRRGACSVGVVSSKSCTEKNERALLDRSLPRQTGTEGMPATSIKHTKRA